MSTALTKAPAEPIVFSVTEQTIAEQFDGYMAMKVNGIHDKAGLSKVKSARMDVVHARTSVEKTKTKMNEEAQRQIKVNGARAKKLLDLLAPIESHLLAEQTAVETELARIKQAEEDALLEVREQRMAELGGVLSEDAMRHMTEMEFECELEKARVAKCHRDRIAAEEAEAAYQRDRERAAIEANNKAEAERLAAERAEFERQKAELEAAAKVERDRLAAIKAEQDAAQAKIDAEKKRLADAEAAKMREETLAEARRFAAEQARVETEQRIAREAAVAKAKAEREEADRVRREAMRPAREKLLAFADAVEALEIPEVSEEFDERIQKALDAAGAVIRACADDAVR